MAEVHVQLEGARSTPRGDAALEGIASREGRRAKKGVFGGCLLSSPMKQVGHGNDVGKACFISK